MLKAGLLSTNILQNTSAAAVRLFSCSSARTIDQRWRDAKGLTANPNAFGPLNSLPDYTFLDGRPTPMGSNLKKRMLKQQEIASKIVTLTAELEFAKERYERNQANQIAEKERILQSKLKPKGYLLLKKQK